MYNGEVIYHLIEFTQDNDGINDKNELAKKFQETYSLIKDRSVYYCDDFAIRFSRSKTKNLGNTVLSLSALQKYDDRPFFVCVTTPKKNYLYLANTTFLSKISHSSQELRMDNIKGSFNGSDIMKVISGINNEPENFCELYQIHEGLTFEDNLERLVEATNNIVGSGHAFDPSSSELEVLLDAPRRAASFNVSPEYIDLRDDLTSRANNVQNEIAIAALIDNVNLRGRVIEYLISSDGGSLKEQIIGSLRDRSPLPEFVTRDGLGDYSKSYAQFEVETDIKTKVLFLNSNPKAYNIDKLLEFLSTEKSVYMVFLVGIDEDGNLATQLCSIFQNQIIDGTRRFFHWAGRNSRGVTQFDGHMLTDAIYQADNIIDIDFAQSFLQSLIDKK